MRQQLQRVEGGKDRHLRVGELPAKGIGDAEEERVAGGEDHHFGMSFVLLKDRFPRHRNLDPLSPFRQQRGDDFVMALSARKDAAGRDGITHLRREPDLPLIRHSDDGKVPAATAAFSLATHRVRV